MRGRSLRDWRQGGRFFVGWGVLVAVATAGTGLAISHMTAERTKLGGTEQETVPVERESKGMLRPSPVVIVPDPAIVQDSPNMAQASTSGRQGFLRISNQTEQVIRVALLIKKPAKSSSGTEPKALYEPPAHWDFDPGEGSEKGLVVSLPKRNLKLKPGDILVAFAQDGSRQYWGPYVVGATPVPVWEPKAREWELVLEPQL